MKRGTPDHPKLKALMVALNVEKYEAVGVLETLWHFTARYAADGDIGRFTDAEIASAIGWKKRSGKAKVSSGSFLVQALVHTRWLDGPYEVQVSSPRGHAEVPPRSLPVPARSLLVHDWKDHADQTLKRFLASRKLAFASPPLPLPVASSLKPLPEPIYNKPAPSAESAADFCHDESDWNPGYYEPEPRQHASSAKPAPPRQDYTGYSEDELLPDWQVEDRLEKVRELGWSEERINYLISLGRRPYKREKDPYAQAQKQA